MSNDELRRLVDEARSGGLRLDPSGLTAHLGQLRELFAANGVTVQLDGLQDAPAQIEIFLKGLDGVAGQLQQLRYLRGFGGFTIGTLLEDKYRAKGGMEVTDRIRELAAQAELMRELFELAIGNYQATEDANIRRQRRAGA